MDDGSRFAFEGSKTRKEMEFFEKKILSTWKDKNQSVTIITINGYPMNGRIVNADRDSILFFETERYSKEIVVYKHAISTIIPN